jgi:tRNA modification GTPase
VEQEGVRRARKRAAEADLVLWLADGPDAKMSHHDQAPVWLVRNKVDLEAGRADAEAEQGAAALFRISASHGDGIAGLISALVDFAQDYFGASESGLISRARQRKLLEQTADSLRRSLDVADTGEELAAEELRAAVFSLGRLLGRVDVEDILDVIFREFCVGK